VDGPIGVLALQGDFAEHRRALERAGAAAREVRVPGEMEGIGGLIIPGGESTTIGKLAVEYGLLEPIRRLGSEGMPIWGVCAGMVLLARDTGGPEQPLLGLMDVRVKRNAFGRQVESFEVDLAVPALDADASNGRFRAIFIRAPAVEEAAEGVQVLARLEGGAIVAVRQGNLLATAFHPELTEDLRFHRYFLGMSE